MTGAKLYFRSTILILAISRCMCTQVIVEKHRKQKCMYVRVRVCGWVYVYDHMCSCINMYGLSDDNCPRERR